MGEAETSKGTTPGPPRDIVPVSSDEHRATAFPQRQLGNHAGRRFVSVQRGVEGGVLRTGLIEHGVGDVPHPTRQPLVATFFR